MPWREDNNIGNSYSNLFGDIDEFEIAHIYCRDGEPYNSKVKRYFQITEGRLAKSIINRNLFTGKTFEMDASKNSKDLCAKSKVMNKARLLRWESLFIARDLIWFLGKWKTRELYSFVESFQPNIIFGTLTYMSNINRMMVDLQKRYKIPLVLNSWDDVYSWHHFSWNPLFLLRKCYNRYYIRKSVAHSSLMYTITKEMQKEYGQYFNKECKLLYKSYDFHGTPKIKKVGNPVKMVFMGNIGAGRWNALAELAKTLADMNNRNNKTIATLHIYTLSPISDEISSALNIEGTSILKNAVPQDEVMQTQQSADILVHVEPMSKKDASLYRLSFSTKLVDYLYNARCILGLGFKTATLSYIERNNVGIVVNNLTELPEKLKDLFGNPMMIEMYGRNAWECGVRHHQREEIKNMLLEDLTGLCAH